MKHILDSAFKYDPSHDTDIRRRFEKIKRQQREAAKAQVEADKEAAAKTIPIRKANGTR